MDETIFFIFWAWSCCRVSPARSMYVCKPPQSEQLVSPVGVISNEAHPFVTHYSVCPMPLSPTAGLTGLPQHTWLWSFCLTSRLFLLAAPTETEPDKLKRGKRGWISMRKNNERERKGAVGKCVCNIPVLVVMVLTLRYKPVLALCTKKKKKKLSLSVSFSVPIPMSSP